MWPTSSAQSGWLFRGYVAIRKHLYMIKPAYLSYMRCYTLRILFRTRSTCGESVTKYTLVARMGVLSRSNSDASRASFQTYSECRRNRKIPLVLGPRVAADRPSFGCGKTSAPTCPNMLTGAPKRPFGKMTSISLKCLISAF